MSDNWENTGMSLRDLAEAFAKSGYYRDATRPEQALVKLLMGKELGLPMLASMAGLQIVEGKPELSGGTLSALIKRSGKYDFRIIEHTNDACTIRFFQLKPEREVLGDVTYSMADAKLAGLAGRSNWTKNPSDMVFVRALSRGYRRHTPDAASLTTIYVEGEIDAPPTPAARTPETEAEQDARNPYMPALAMAALSQGLDSVEQNAASLQQVQGMTPDPDTVLEKARRKSRSKGEAPSLAPTTAQVPSPDLGTGQEEEANPPASPSIDQETGEVFGPPSPGPQEFVYNGTTYRTKGLTIEQFAESTNLLTTLVEKVGVKQANAMAREAMAYILGRDGGNRVDLTQTQGEQLIGVLRVPLNQFAESTNLLTTLVEKVLRVPPNQVER